MLKTLQAFVYFKDAAWKGCPYKTANAETPRRGMNIFAELLNVHLTYVVILSNHL